MSYRKERIHTTGHSNIDYRTKNDEPSLHFYQPWKPLYPPNTTMPSYPTHLSYTEHKKLFNFSSPINKQINIANDLPDPKTYQSAKFYQQHHIKLNTKALFTNERIANLDESYKGKDRFLGDSMMISDINKIRKERKRRRRLHEQEKKKKIIMQENIIKDKTKKNKEAYQETQLVNIEAQETLEGKVDLMKLLEIRLALRRRYANRTNFRKIFKEWDNTAQGEISVYDAHKMINNLNIPINYNETRALIASSNQRGTEALNLKEFMHLIFSDNPALNVDLSKLQFKEEKIFDDGAEVENLKHKMKTNIMEMNRYDDLAFLEHYLRTKKPMFISKLKELDLPETEFSNETCTFDTFVKVMKRFHLPEKYTNELLLQTIYEKYKAPNKDEMNYMEYLNYCVNKKEVNDFFDFQNKNLELLNNKISQNQIENKPEVISVFNRKHQLNKELSDYYTKQIQEHLIKKTEYDIKKDKISTSHYQPSTEFINLIYKDKDKHYTALNEVEDSFTAHPSIIKELKGKTRFGANPRNVNTFGVIQPNSASAMYMSEDERFKVRGNDLIDFVHNERYKNKLRNEAVANRKYNAIKRSQDIADFNSLLAENKYNISQIGKTKIMQRYEIINKMTNELIE